MYPATGIILLFSSLTVQILSEECVTPNKEKAQCISLYSCPVLIGALATPQAGPIEFIRQSNCGGTASDPMVCCGSSGNFTEKKPSENDHSRDETQKINLLPTRRFCGYQHSDDYFHTPNVTLPIISEFPWLAAIVPKERASDGDARPICAGSLINNRYVLTAAHCVGGLFSRPVAVHLGEYHIGNNTDCIQEPPFDEECSAPVEVFDVEKTIPHHKYTTMNEANDIALLRLNRTVSYSDYIRPICLPLPGTTLAKVGDILTSSGWGLAGRNEGAVAVEIKKKILSTLIENKQCMLALHVGTRNSVTENNLCTIVVDSSSNVQCAGDSGGPLLFSYRQQWHQEGVVSFSQGCGGADPVVYGKVVNYLDWILENIEK